MLNRLPARAPTDFRLLTARYGKRFQNLGQDMIVPAPSGLLAPVRLIEADASDQPCGG